MGKIKVLVYEPSKMPEAREIENTLEVLQELVGGHIENVRLDCNVNLICNEEGKIKNLPPSIYLYNDVIAGTCIFAGDDRENEDYKSLDDSQIVSTILLIASHNGDYDNLLKCAKTIYYKEEVNE
ncbi:DUF3846 domain-containing protein [Breznakia pachnodae]|uniref:DUF3846 domain-containing protein n=1 Tax=Breznakia pachnodae TaxID=265178 RepID=A0ABU0E6X7_9FIRM|nr:DUF3846 domain-containing protein [Breznakia pachnodae]MDQ0362576.1 hypothetical protein [Breznakia pachnodae]